MDGAYSEGLGGGPHEGEEEVSEEHGGGDKGWGVEEFE